MIEQGETMAHRKIVTTTKKGTIRTQYKSTGHNNKDGRPIDGILKSREKADEKEK